ncbi:MAG: hypothetical protein HON94_03620, partial [Methylococcales bacterium]|nr:hypothetical protein [Methylococcales bacterium]
MIFLNKSSPLLKIGNSFILILFIAVISFSIFQFYSVETSLKNRQRLESVKNKYFPILERIDQNIVRLNHIKELHLQAVMTGESGLLNEAEKEWQQAIKTFQEMKLIAPASSTRIEDLRQQFRRYVKLGSGTSETIIDQLGVTTNISPLIAQMNIDLELLHREIRIFRQNSYKQFVSTLNKSNDSADQNLYFGIAIGLMNLIFMGILVFFIINNKK